MLTHLLTPPVVPCLRGLSTLMLGIVCVSLVLPHRASAQTSQAILVDGSGPWQDARWVYTAGQFRASLAEAAQHGAVRHLICRG